MHALDGNFNIFYSALFLSRLMLTTVIIISALFF